jgi:hypothetical protein
MVGDNVWKSKVFPADKKGKQLVCWICLVALLSIIWGLSTQASAAVNEGDRALAQQVFHQLLAVVPSQRAIPWPPTLETRQLVLRRVIPVFFADQSLA